MGIQICHISATLKTSLIILVKILDKKLNIQNIQIRYQTSIFLGLDFRLILFELQN